MPHKRVIIFTQPSCIFSNRAKEFLLDHGVPYDEQDVSQEPSALAELERRGLMTTPVMLVGEEVIVGFDQKKLSVLLGLD